jgi:autotransporter-associated beta strand protein
MKSRSRSLIVLGAGLSCIPSFALAVQTYNDSLVDYAGNAGASAGMTNGVPNATDSYMDIASVVITNNASNILFRINLNPTVTNASGTQNTDILTTAQSYGLYEVGLETVPLAGSTAVLNPYGAPIGISTGMNYWIGSWTNQGGGGTDADPDFGDNQAEAYSAGTWSVVAGNGLAGNGTIPSQTTSTALTQTSTTLTIPLAALGLSIGNNFHFDVWATFGGNGGAYDALDSGPAATLTAASGYEPWAPMAYDSATATGSTYSTTTYTVAVPTFTWNDATAAAGYFDGTTWDVNDNTKYNWNNGIYADYYTDNANVIFNDNNSGNYAVTLNTVVTPASVTVNNSSNNYTISGTGSIAGATTTLTKLGSDVLTLSNTGTNTYGGGTTVSAGTLLIAAAGALPAASNVTVTGGTLQLGASTGVETLSSLSISTAGTFDVNNNHIIISYTGSQATEDSLIRSYLVTGYNGGAWNGDGLDSSAANALFAAGNKHYGLGYADGADMNGSSPLVAGLGAGNIEIKYTLYGDANLDGVVNGTDFGILAAHFGDQVTAWDEGDFNYDGVVNGSDFGALAANFGQQANGTAVELPAADYAALDAFAAANGLLADVPEPASVGLMVLAGIGIVGRRSRRCRTSA